MIYDFITIGKSVFRKSDIKSVYQTDYTITIDTYDDSLEIEHETIAEADKEFEAISRQLSGY